MRKSKFFKLKAKIIKRKKKTAFVETQIYVKTSMYTKKEAVWPIRYREKCVLVCKNSILRKTHLKSKIIVFFFFFFFNFETFEIAIYAKVLQNEVDSILRLKVSKISLLISFFKLFCSFLKYSRLKNNKNIGMILYTFL